MHEDRDEAALAQTSHPCFTTHNFVCHSRRKCFFDSLAGVWRDLARIHTGFAQQFLPKAWRRLNGFHAQPFQSDFMLGKNEWTAAISKCFFISLQNRFAALAVFDAEIA